MKDIVLIHPAIDFEDNYPCSWIPYSILSLASRISTANYRVHIYDEHKMTKEEIIMSISTYTPFAVGITIMTGGGQIERVLSFAKYFKNTFPECFVIFGGPHVNVLPKQTIENELIDFVSAGPGQNTLIQLLDALSNNSSVDSIPGIYYKNKDERKVYVPQKLKATIPHLYSYNFGLINPEEYVRYDSTISARTINYIASQGCPYACKFCYECSYDKKYYTMGVENVYKDIKLLVEKYNINGIKFYDADFFINEKRCIQIIKILKGHNLAWAASIHPNDILRAKRNGENKLLRSITESNCKRLLMGMESGSNHVLNDIVNKHVTAEELVEVAKEIGYYGILGSYTFMVGYPDETEYEQEKTFKLIEQLWSLNIPIETKVHIYLPYPGTPLYNRAIELGFDPPKKLADWSDFNYYKAMTPWTDEHLEKRVIEYTKMVDKNKLLQKEDY